MRVIINEVQTVKNLEIPKDSKESGIIHYGPSINVLNAKTLCIQCVVEPDKKLQAKVVLQKSNNGKKWGPVDEVHAGENCWFEVSPVYNFARLVYVVNAGTLSVDAHIIAKD